MSWEVVGLGQDTGTQIIVTRMIPPRVLDPIITTLSNYYQLPQCLSPLEADHDSNGKPSDHMMVVMEPKLTHLSMQIRRG